jgi:phosphoribosylamine--glycine ligase
LNVLLIGGGGREHAVAWKLRQSPRLTDLHIAPGNGGTGALGNNLELPVPHNGSPEAEVRAYLDAVAVKAREIRADLVFVAPDDPLGWGLVDRLAVAGIPAFGPSRAAAEIEWSKVWSREFMERHGIAQPASASFDSASEARAYIEASSTRLVVKADGLSVGKGSIVTSTREEALAAVEDLMEKGALGAAGSRVVIQERLEGRECSAHAFTDGRTVASMPLSCDHKPVFDGNQGPNTGGMGVYCPPWWADQSLAEVIHQQVTVPAVQGMMADGRPFRGVLYPGIMVTDAGPRVIEFNARLGDPEAQALLPLLKTDLLEVAWAIVNDRLHEVAVEWEERASVCVVMASGGYPGAYETGIPISGLDDLEAGVEVFHAGTRRAQGGGLVTGGGRVLGVVATAKTLAEARATAYRNVERIHFQRAHYRRDIGLQN